MIFDSLPGLPGETTANFRTYINTIGIAHDFGDVVADIKSDNTTVATAVDLLPGLSSFIG